MIRLPTVHLFRLFTARLCSTRSKVTETDKTTLIQQLSVEYEVVGPVMDVLKNQKLENLCIEDWRTRINFLKSFNFTDFDCFKMISRYPELMQVPQNKLEETTRLWFGSELQTNSVTSLLFFQPGFFDIDATDLAKRISLLQSKFRKSEALADLFRTCPNVLFENWNFVLMKIDYLLKVRGYTIGDVLHSKALSFTLDHIKLRFEILEKCGVYKQEKNLPHKINKFEKTGPQNPPLKTILIENDQKFATLVANISLEEYNVCKDLFDTYGSFNDVEDDDEDNDTGYHK